MNSNTKNFKQLFESMSPDEILSLNRKNDEEHQKQYDLFQDHYSKEQCYLCNKQFKTISFESPCLHWLLRQCKFKKKDFVKVYERFDYHHIAAYLRWCANQERYLSNINDLESERESRKIINNTIRWKNIEWTFDCSQNDLEGHKGTSADFPHFHFQMRIDGRQFINFNDFHIPFSEEDMFILTLREEDWFEHDFGVGGMGMEDAMNVPPQTAIELMSTTNEANASHHLSTIIQATDTPISGELIYEITQEAEKQGKPIALIAKQKLEGKANVKVIITPAETIPDIAKRTPHTHR